MKKTILFLITVITCCQYAFAQKELTLDSLADDHQSVSEIRFDETMRETYHNVNSSSAKQKKLNSVRYRRSRSET